MTEVALYQQQTAELAVAGHSFDDWIPVLQQVVGLAEAISDSPFVPDGLRGSVPAVAAAILTARELGVPPMTGLANIHLIKGKTGLTALLMRALIQSKGHQWEDVEVSDTRCVLRGRRRGETEWTEASFNADQAKRANIQLNPYPQDKLYARATVRLARRKFADVIAGMPYSAEELEDGELDQLAETTEQPAVAATAQRTARRRQAPAERPTAARPAPATAPTAGPATGQAARPGCRRCRVRTSRTLQRTQQDTGSAPSSSAAGEPTDDDLPVMKALSDFTVDLARHADHKLSKHGRCVYCDTCGQRLYQGLMLSAEDRAELRKILDEHGTSTRGKGGQLTALWTVLSTIYDFEDKDEARKVVEKLISRQLDGGTTGDLSYNEARALLDTLAQVTHKAESDGITPREQLIVFLTEIDKAQGGE